VLGASTTLIDYGKADQAVRDDLLVSIREEAERLNRYVGNLLDMTRLEGGALRLRTDWTDVRDVLNAAAERVSRRLAAGTLPRLPGELSLVQVDASLLEQAVVNILENAIAYSPDGARIEMAAYEDRSNVVISIEDEGGASRPPSWSGCSRSSAAWRSPPTAARARAWACRSPRASSTPWAGASPPPARSTTARARAS
jgi:K+-sensing histidine kinase KdpD